MSTTSCSQWNKYTAETALQKQRCMTSAVPITSYVPDVFVQFYSNKTHVASYLHHKSCLIPPSPALIHCRDAPKPSANRIFSTAQIMPFYNSVCSVTICSVLVALWGKNRRIQWNLSCRSSKTNRCCAYFIPFMGIFFPPIFILH